MSRRRGLQQCSPGSARRVVRAVSRELHAAPAPPRVSESPQSRCVCSCSYF